MSYSIKEIAKIIKAKQLVLSTNEITTLLTDSRSLSFPSETLFFALITKRNDGHKYIPELYRKGVKHFVVSYIQPEWNELTDAVFLEVNDTLATLQQLVAEHRRYFKIPIIGITGSNGKTVVKEWLYRVLSSPTSNIVRSPRSYNSQTGVPLSVWQLNEKSQIGIFEAGISQHGEMDSLAMIIRPTIGILTNIGEAHQSGFKSLQEKCIEKLRLFKGADTLIYDGDNRLLRECIEMYGSTIHEIAWSRINKDSPLYIAQINRSESSTHIQYEYLRMEGNFDIPFTDNASIENAINTLAASLYLGVSPATIAQRMTLLEPVAMRLEVNEGINHSMLINDTYNSDITSLDIALDFEMRRSSYSDLTPTLILSDIEESGLLPARLYQRVAELLLRKGIKQFIGIGSELTRHQDLFKDIPSSFFLTTNDFLHSGVIEKLSHSLILIKGARNFQFERISDVLELKQHETILEVNLDAIAHNFHTYKAKLRPDTQIICMVKAFGYGAGSYELAKTLQEVGCDYLAVAVADEGAELRNAGINMPLMVMNPEISGFRTIFEYRLEPEIYSFKLLAAFIREAQRLGITHYPIHIKIDTGMHRLGFLPSEMPQLLEILANESAVMVRSVFSHLAASDNPEYDQFTLQQINTFIKSADQLQSIASYHIKRHILNSAGITRFTNYQMDMVRLGIGLYGIKPSADMDDLHHVSTLKTIILQIKKLEAGETVGYGRNALLTRPSRIAMLPIGYADGMNRHWGNYVGHVIVNGQKAPIIGSICMDVCMIDVTDVECKEGDLVELFGSQILVEYIAEKLNTIPYEILTSISNRVKRIYYRE